MDFFNRVFPNFIANFKSELIIIAIRYFIRVAITIIIKFSIIKEPTAKEEHANFKELFIALRCSIDFVIELAVILLTSTIIMLIKVHVRRELAA